MCVVRLFTCNQDLGEWTGVWWRDTQFKMLGDLHLFLRITSNLGSLGSICVNSKVRTASKQSPREMLQVSAPNLRILCSCDHRWNMDNSGFWVFFSYSHILYINTPMHWSPGHYVRCFIYWSLGHYIGCFGPKLTQNDQVGIKTVKHRPWNGQKRRHFWNSARMLRMKTSDIGQELDR